MTRSSILLLLLACGGPPPDSRAARPAPAPRPRPTPSRRALPGYPPPVEPAAVACVITGTWPFDQPRELRFRRGGRTFATMNHIEAAALSLGGEPASPFVELRSGHARLWGVVVADQLLLHPAHPMLLDGYLAPGPTAVLRWLGAEREPAAVEVQVPDFVKPSSPPRADLRCSDLAIDEKEFEAREAIEAADGEPMMLVDKKPIPLSREPGGPTAAVIEFADAGSPSVEVIERRGEWARVVVLHSSLNPAENVLVVGWVAASAVAPHSHGFGGSWGQAGDGSGPLPRRRTDRQLVTCPHEVPLVVELEGEQHLVGAVASGVGLEVPAGAGTAVHGLVEIALRSRQVEFADEVRLLAKGSSLADCSPALAPEH